MKSVTYKDAGVDIDRGDGLAQWIAAQARSTHSRGVVGGIGSFAGLFQLPAHYQDPLLVSTTDGVGTKLEVARLAGKHDSVGIDLVAMCVNDLICCGGRPLFFLDYFATGRLNEEQAQDVLRGIVDGCRQADCALLGGETAEMPGMYAPGKYDLAGFAVGAVERSKVIDGRRIEAGDVVLGLPSSGIHSNGFSLARRVLLADSEGEGTGVDPALLQTLLTPTKIYVRAMARLIDSVDVRGAVHITGGGLLDNPPRCLPEGLCYQLDPSCWQVPEIMLSIAKHGPIGELEMRRVFNLGLGMLLVLPADAAQLAERLTDDYDGRVVGRIAPRAARAVEFTSDVFGGCGR